MRPTQPPTRRQAIALAGATAVAGGVAASRLTDAPLVRAAAQRLGADPSWSTSHAAEVEERRRTIADAVAAARDPLTPVAVSPALTVEHVARRLTYGPTPAVRQEVTKAGIGLWLAAQLAPERIPDPIGTKVDALFPRLGWTIAEAHAMRSQDPKYYEFLYEVPLRHLGRALWSSRQLSELMVEFWSNHLHVPTPAEKGSHARHRYDQDVIRKHALGRFEDMLLASAVHPAMLAYLDNELSTREAPNENFAREVLELHTLGVDGGYTERDIKQSALLLTGWRSEEGVTGFVSARHFPGPVTVLGTTYTNGRSSHGRLAQLDYLRALARHPSTARHIARKLAIRFVSDSPSDALVGLLADTYTAGGTAITPVLRVLFGSEEFAASADAKSRRPTERMLAALRAVGAEYTGEAEGLQSLYWMTQEVGHAPMAWPTPDGYPDVARAWQSPATALQLINSLSSFVHGWSPKTIGLDGPGALLRTVPGTRSGVVDAVAQRLFGRAALASERSAVLDLLQASTLRPSLKDQWQREETVALTTIVLMASPAFLSR